MNTGRSLMPEGFEGLGGETLRDIIAYMQSVDGGQFRTVDLREAFTASTTARGLYDASRQKRDSLEFVEDRHGDGRGVPFNIVCAGQGAELNIIVLKGGPAKIVLQDAAAARGGQARRLHGEPAALPRRRRRLGLARATATTNDLMKVTVALRRRAEARRLSCCRTAWSLPTTSGEFDVPGSKLAEGLVKAHQLRWFSKQLSRTGADRQAHARKRRSATHAPTTFVAITAELAEANAAPLAKAAARQRTCWSCGHTPARQPPMKTRISSRSSTTPCRNRPRRAGERPARAARRRRLVARLREVLRRGRQGDARAARRLGGFHPKCERRRADPRARGRARLEREPADFRARRARR